MQSPRALFIILASVPARLYNIFSPRYIINGMIFGKKKKKKQKNISQKKNVLIFFKTYIQKNSHP